MNCNGDATYTATYAPAYIDYTVVFKNWDDTVISSKTYHYGDAVTAPSNPTKEADNTYTYAFAGWDSEVKACVGDATYTATYTPVYIEYTVVFKDWDDTVISSKTYHYGDAVTTPNNPAKAADNTYTYTFQGWDKSVVNCVGNATYTATYASTYIDYTVIFKDWNGAVLSSKTYHYGNVVTAPANPARAADNTYTYAFNGWDNEVTSCVGNATYSATYTATYIDYTVIFANWDGTVISSKTYHYGASVTAPANPTRPNDDSYIYTFAGWDKAIVSCSGNATYTATYSKQNRVPSSITSSTYTIGSGTISKISTGTTVATLISKLNEGQYVKVYNGNAEVTGTTVIGTGMVVKIMDGKTAKASYTVVVTGDTNGDGGITITDMIAVKAHVLQKSTLTGASASAADTNGDNGISITDFIQVKAHILGKSQVEARSESASTRQTRSASVEVETPMAESANDAPVVMVETTAALPEDKVAENYTQVLAIAPTKESYARV